MSNRDLTPDLNTLSINNTRDMINKKISPYPFLSNGTLITNSITDRDHHPYTREFRGVYYYDRPVILEREAGWRPIRNSCYDLVLPKPKELQPEHCFEYPCTTIFKCVPKFTRYGDQEALQEYINRTCPLQYR
jgi:hypothetical protein